MNIQKLPAHGNPIVSIVPQKPFDDQKWLQFFNPALALAAVAAHIKALPSSQTPERHTERSYQSGLQYFLNWAGNRLPTEDLVAGFIAHLKDRGLTSTTIGCKYLAPLRLYLRKLAGQHIPVTGAERDYVSDCKERIRAAIELRTPRSETTTNIAPLWNPKHKRLQLRQVNAVLRRIDRNTIAGLRDYALLHIGFSAALRIAELQRLTLDNIYQDGAHFFIHVRGKRGNTDPVPISEQCFNDVHAYVTAYNAPLSLIDPRRITGNTALWQPLLKNDTHPAIYSYNHQRGLSVQAIRNIIRRRTASALGEDHALAPHDLRRTAAAIAYDKGMGPPDIQQLLRHKNIGVTMNYVGQKPDFASRALHTYVRFG